MTEAVSASATARVLTRRPGPPCDDTTTGSTAHLQDSLVPVAM